MSGKSANRSLKHSPKRASRGPTATSKSEPKGDRPVAPGYGIVGAKDGKGLLPWAWVTKKMNSCRTFWLATIHSHLTPDHARPHVMPLWGVWVDDAFYFSTGRTSRKGQNLAANPACTITNDDGEEAVIVEGKATQVEGAPELERVAFAYKKKYKLDPRSMGEPIFRLRPTTVFGFIEKSFPNSATRWKF